MQVAKWGNSLAVRLPAAVVEALKLREGDEIEIRVADAREFEVARRPGRKELEHFPIILVHSLSFESSWRIRVV
ncbi:MAG: AbrB/MazE/SpoVT family DNA-binding domain-containing protein [Alphaproteobacteria bacterium]|nr:AbrB/MazE/SpoVT family DNA-binding domain-containing protein [Alphaproteobacteria bacterium]